MKISNFKFLPAGKAGQIWGILLFVLFAAFSFLVSLGLFLSIDYQATVLIQQILPSFVTTPFSVFSILGSAEIASLFLLVLLILITKLRKLYVLILYGLTGLIEILEKSIITQNGPPIEFLKTNLHLGFPSGSVSHGFFSYPSGHLARASFVSAVLLFVFWKSSKISKNMKFVFIFLILTFDLVMFLSRVYLGEHWLTDATGGTILGFSLGAVAIYFLAQRKTD